MLWSYNGKPAKRVLRLNFNLNYQFDVRWVWWVEELARPHVNATDESIVFE